MLDHARAIEAWLRDENVIDAPIRPRRPGGEVIAPRPRGAFAAIARMIPGIAPIGTHTFQGLKTFEVAHLGGLGIGVEIADEDRGKLALGATASEFVEDRHLSLALVAVVRHVKRSCGTGKG